MAEYEHSATIPVSSDALFQFVSNVGNLPQYLPTTRSAQPQGNDRVRVQGEAHGHQYEDDGYFRVDQRRQYMEWGSDEGHYSGWLQVRGEGQESSLTVHLSLSARDGGDQQMPNQDQRVQEGLEAAIQSIRNVVQGQGGKVEPRSAHERGE